MKVSYGDIQVAIFKVMHTYWDFLRDILIKVATNFVFRSSIRPKPDPDV